MTTSKIEILLMQEYVNMYLVVPRTYIAKNYEADICLLSKKTNYAAEIEIKNK